MTTRVLLDASAILAYLQDEPGAAQVADALSGGNASCTAANWAEVVTKVVAKQLDWRLAETALSGQGLGVLPVDRCHAVAAGLMWTTHPALSLGDRLCLAVGERLDVPILTTDRYWVNVTPLVQVIR